MEQSPWRAGGGPRKTAPCAGCCGGPQAGRSAPRQTADLMGHPGRRRRGHCPHQALGQQFSKQGPGAAAPAAPGNLPGMRILRPHPRLLNQYSWGWGPVLRALLLPRGCPLEPEDQALEQIFPTGGPRWKPASRTLTPQPSGHRVEAGPTRVPSPAVPNPVHCTNMIFYL